MENLSIILIGIIVVLIAVIAFIKISEKKCSSCSTCPPPPVCNLFVTKQDIEKDFKSTIVPKLRGPSFILPNNLTEADITNALNNGKVVLPQDISFLTSKQLASLTPAELYLTVLGFSLIQKKIEFSAEQLKDLTPQQIESIFPFQFANVIRNIEDTKNILSPEQISTLKSL